jgi:CheY-like chemotaxis protein
VAEERGLEFSVELDESLPESMRTDDMRLRQILRNLLSNAFKFTEVGTVRMRIFRYDQQPPGSRFEGVQDVIGFAVEDTGEGIAEEKQRIIFEPFTQADGGTSRRHGGTGLGLSISRELTSLLGGELHVQSALGRGSTFTLSLPLSIEAPAYRRQIETLERARLPAPVVSTVADDRAAISEGDRVFLIIEDDDTFARVMLDIAREYGFRGLVALDGNKGLELAKSMHPDAITLDLRLPDMDGRVLLDRLKHDPATRHIPIHVISGAENSQRVLLQGALTVSRKPVERPELDHALGTMFEFLGRKTRELLIVEPELEERTQLLTMVGNSDVHTTAVERAEDAIELLRGKTFDCLVLDLADDSAFELVRALEDLPERRPPTLVYRPDLRPEEAKAIDNLAKKMVLRTVDTREQLLAETVLFLHREEKSLPDPLRDLLRRFTMSDPMLSGRSVLVVDDDVRNIFAITAFLESHGCRVLTAENGHEALEKLESESDVDLVLMDIMMPGMDGYEAMRRIRRQRRFVSLPVVALTAKAMKADRDKCIDAGASDYIPKPVDPELLLSLLRVWLDR